MSALSVTRPPAAAAEDAAGAEADADVELAAPVSGAGAEARSPFLQAGTSNSAAKIPSAEILWVLFMVLR